MVFLMEAIALLFNTFPLLGVLSPGDPCLPAPFPWVELVGTQLPDFSAMDALETIDLSNDFLVLDFPDFLADFPKLKELNLANVLFSGTIPTSLRDRSKNKTLKLTYGQPCVFLNTGSGTTGGTSTGNDGLTTTSFTTPTKSRKNKTVPIALGTGIPIFLILWANVAQMNGTSGLAMPMYGNTMSPNPLLPGVNFLDIESAQNFLPDDRAVNTDQQKHPTVQAT
ncbi:hypothetical protein MKX01_036910 [Papaver californicum]|nr:hypothetical protein MKX01_036910 [Papaver californicum]